eukprot:Gb_41332 [translate_table: standard]
MPTMEDRGYKSGCTMLERQRKERLWQWQEYCVMAGGANSTLARKQNTESETGEFGDHSGRRGHNIGRRGEMASLSVPVPPLGSEKGSGERRVGAYMRGAGEQRAGAQGREGVRTRGKFATGGRFPMQKLGRNKLHHKMS